MPSPKKSKWLVPQWEGPIEGWVVNMMSKHYWRVEATLERSDLIQEAYVVFLRCKEAYAGKIKASEPQHFMSLFQRSFLNTIHDLSVDDTRFRETFVPDHVTQRDGESGSWVPIDYAGDTDNDGTLATLIRQAPREVSMVLNLFLSAPEELLEVALGSWRGRDKRCKTGGSERICRLLGLPKDLDVMARVEEYFANS